MLIMTSKGLYCPAGKFYIDPNRAVSKAVITHAHSDHARKGSQQYYCTTSGVDLLKVRLGNQIDIQSYCYGEKFHIGDVQISFHPAGHILGSSQIRLELYGEVWVVSGDYKRIFDPTCEPFEPVLCNVFITEATFGTPAFSWNKEFNYGKAIFDWWHNNAIQGLNSVLFAYSLGKSQRILSDLTAFMGESIYCDQATEKLNLCYRAQGIKLASTLCLNDLPDDQILERKLFLVPPSFLKTNQAKILGNGYKTAFASGWMSKRSHEYDEGFIMSDHADWKDLLLTIEQTSANRVYVQHRGHGALVKKLKSQGIKAFCISALTPKNPNQLLLF